MESFHRANIPVKLQRFVKAHDSSSGKPTDIRAIVIGDEVVSAMERTASQGDFRANLSKGGSGRSINLSDAETEMCIKAANAVSLEFAGVHLIREKMGQTYVTEVNGNPRTGIIDITKKNLIKLVQERSKKGDKTPPPVPLPNEDKDENQEKENEEESSVRQHEELLVKESKEKLSYNGYSILGFLKRKFGQLNNGI